MERSELMSQYQALIAEHNMFSGCAAMGLVKEVFANDEYNVFDREYMIRQLIEDWVMTHDTIIIPPNPHNAKYLVISLDHPNFYNFTDDKEQALDMRRLNSLSGYPTRIVDTTTATIVVD